jgi:two-component sensor histidine kinase
MIRRVGIFSILALRVAVSAWFLLFGLGMFLGLAFDVAYRGDMLYGFWTVLLCSLTLFPQLALMWGGWCTWRQGKALARIEGAPDLLSVGSRKSIHVELPCEQALRVAESALRSAFVVSHAQVNDLGIAARITEIAGTTALWPWRFEDNLGVTVAAQGEDRCVLQIAIDPVHVWVYGLFAVDGGRCARRMQLFERALQDRLLVQNAVLDDARRQEATRARRSEAQLAMLRAHVEPHFIFNTLAHVRASLGPQDGTAASMLDALVEFLRRNSLALNGDETSLGEELAMADSYLRIIGLRLGERLRYDLECPPTLRDRSVPAASVLVLVENAVKHGIERSAAGGRIAVRCAPTGDGGICLSVANDGPPFEAAGGGRGGLSNLQERIRMLYGASRPLEIENPETGGTRVTIVLPPAAQQAAATA